MKFLNQLVKVMVHEGLYKKDPETSELGRKIVGEGILLIDELGFEQFTFKKLGERIQSNESSIYRYFENKHMLLLYLASWYWGWFEYRLVFQTTNISDAREKLKKAIEIFGSSILQDTNFSHINEEVLHRIIVNEYSKSYLTKEVDSENKQGFFSVYKRLVMRLSEMISEVSPEYPYSLSLASTVVEGTLHQQFLKEHFPTLTDFQKSDSHEDFFCALVFNNLNTTK